jgi:hypothetical protein
MFKKGVGLRDKYFPTNVTSFFITLSSFAKIFHLLCLCLAGVGSVVSRIGGAKNNRFKLLTSTSMIV